MWCYTVYKIIINYPIYVSECDFLNRLAVWLNFRWCNKNAFLHDESWRLAWRAQVDILWWAFQTLFQILANGAFRYSDPVLGWVPFAHSSWCVMTCLGFNFPWCCLAARLGSSADLVHLQEAEKERWWERNTCVLSPAWRPQIPAWWHQALELYCKCSLQQLHAEQKYRMEETSQKYHETNLSLEQPYLEAYDSRCPKMIKHAGKAFRDKPRIQESKNPRITQIQQISTGIAGIPLGRPCWAHLALHDAQGSALGVLQNSQDETWLDMWTEYTNCLASFQNWFDSCLGLFQETMQWLVCDGMCENFVISAPLQSASCSKILAHQMAFPVVPRWWKGRIEIMDMLEGNIPRQFHLLREGNDKQSGHNSTYRHTKCNTLPSLRGSSSFDRGPSPSYISVFPVFHWACLASQRELFSSLSLRKMSKHWPEHTHGLLNISEPMAFVRYGRVKK